jgi:uncharacterized protein YbbC (DUF1343 family)
MYTLPIKPSPNLPNLRSILLYPGLCFFEGTTLSVGRGTDKQFQVVGSPDYPDHEFSFTPRSTHGAKTPPLIDKLCYGLDLSSLDVDSLFATRQLNLSVLLHFYNTMDTATFWNAKWFDTLAGGPGFRKDVQAGWDEEKIRSSWKEGLEKFNEKRKQYLLYKDFE